MQNPSQAVRKKIYGVVAWNSRIEVCMQSNKQGVSMRAGAGSCSSTHHCQTTSNYSYPTMSLLCLLPFAIAFCQFTAVPLCTLLMLPLLQFSNANHCSC